VSGGLVGGDGRSGQQKRRSVLVDRAADLAPERGDGLPFVDMLGPRWRCGACLWRSCRIPGASNRTIERDLSVPEKRRTLIKTH
jgi:hypothetical protein